MSAATDVLCLRCKLPTDYLGQLPLMTGRHSGMAKLVFGQWAELDESSWPIDVYRCRHCGHLEMFDLSVAPSA